MNDPLRPDINDALKHAGLGPHQHKTPMQLLLEKAHETDARVFQLSKQLFKDHAPTRDEFASVVGQAYEHEFSKWSVEERLVYLSAICMETAYKALYD